MATSRCISSVCLPPLPTAPHITSSNAMMFQKEGIARYSSGRQVRCTEVGGPHLPPRVQSNSRLNLILYESVAASMGSDSLTCTSTPHGLPSLAVVLAPTHPVHICDTYKLTVQWTDVVKKVLAFDNRSQRNQHLHVTYCDDVLLPFQRFWTGQKHIEVSGAITIFRFRSTLAPFQRKT